jgi:hypothetical protein
MRVINPAILHDRADKTADSANELVGLGVEDIDRLVAAVGQEEALARVIEVADIERRRGSPGTGISAIFLISAAPAVAISAQAASAVATRQLSVMDMMFLPRMSWPLFPTHSIQA